MSKEVGKCKKGDDYEIGLLTKISFAVFLVGFLSLLGRCVYPARFAVVEVFSDIYLHVTNASLDDKIAMVLGAITIIGFCIFVLSLSNDEEDER